MQTARRCRGASARQPTQSTQPGRHGATAAYQPRQAGTRLRLSGVPALWPWPPCGRARTDSRRPGAGGSSSVALIRKKTAPVSRTSYCALASWGRSEQPCQTTAPPVKTHGEMERNPHHIALMLLVDVNRNGSGTRSSDSVARRCARTSILRSSHKPSGSSRRYQRIDTLSLPVRSARLHTANG